MTYPQKNLNPSETVALDIHPHWWFFAEPVAALAASVVLGIVALAKAGDSDAGKAFKWLVLVLLLVTAVWTLTRYLRWLTTMFVVTSQRVIYRAGVIAKSGVEIPLERVNNVNFHQSIFERMLGAGDLLIESGGETGKQRFTDIRRPDRVQMVIHAQIEQARRLRGGSDLGTAQVDVAGQLERLEGMLERGTLTRDEFEAQKRKLFG